MSVDENLIASAVPDALLGTLLADNAYEIISQLGKGGMSVVYKARYLPLDQMVAVKILHAYANGAATMQRLKNEAKLASSLHHPNILRVCNQLENGDRIMAAAHEQCNLAGDNLTWPGLKKACDDERAACLTRLKKPAEKPPRPLLKD